MSARQFTVELPDSVFEAVRKRAQESNRSVQAEVIELLQAKLADESASVESIEEALGSLALLDDDALWQAARMTFPQDLSERTADLNYKQQRQSLTASEREELKLLLSDHDRYVLIRSQAMLLLKQRGHDISSLLVPPRV